MAQNWSRLPNTSLSLYGYIVSRKSRRSRQVPASGTHYVEIFTLRGPLISRLFIPGLPIHRLGDGLLPPWVGRASAAFVFESTAGWNGTLSKIAPLEARHSPWHLPNFSRCSREYMQSPSPFRLALLRSAQAGCVFSNIFHSRTY